MEIVWRLRRLRNLRHKFNALNISKKKLKLLSYSRNARFRSFPFEYVTIVFAEALLQ